VRWVTQPAPDTDGVRKPRAAWGWFVAGLCLLAYLGSGPSLAGNDATANVHLVPRLLGHGTVYFTVRDNPKMFVFAARTPYGWTRASVLDWNAEVGGTTARKALERGDLRMVRPRYPHGTQASTPTPLVWGQACLRCPSWDQRGS
jgi:hypothetical protein